MIDHCDERLAREGGQEVDLEQLFAEQLISIERFEHLETRQSCCKRHNAAGFNAAIINNAASYLDIKMHKSCCM